MPAPRSKKASSTAELSPVEKVPKTGPAAKRTPKKASAPARKPRPRTTPPKVLPETPVAAAMPETPVAAERPAESPPARRPARIVFWALLAVIPAVALGAFGAFLLVRGDDSQDPIRAGAPAAVSPDELASFAGSHQEPVYWAGRVPARKIELRTTRVGTFVRYLPAGELAGDPGTALTIATYPLRNAFATATRRAGAPRMARRTLAAGGIAVWSLANPTSIYLAFQGVPYLVEVYGPTPAEARRFALSGRVRPVS